MHVLPWYPRQLALNQRHLRDLYCKRASTHRIYYHLKKSFQLHACQKRSFPMQSKARLFFTPVVRQNVPKALIVNFPHSSLWDVSFKSYYHLNANTIQQLSKIHSFASMNSKQGWVTCLFLCWRMYTWKALATVGMDLCSNIASAVLFHNTM